MPPSVDSRKKLQERLFDKVSSIPPQFSFQHIRAMSISGTIGTGIFITSFSTSLRQAGPGGVFLAYLLTSTIVYSTSTSSAEMMAHMPNVGGLIGLADVYVDPALGFAMGWGWSCQLPSPAAAYLLKSYISNSVTQEETALFYCLIAVFLFTAVTINCLSARRIGAIHVAFATLKLATLASLVLAALIVDWTPVPACNTWPAPEFCPNFNQTLSSSLHCVPSLRDHDRVTIGGTYWNCPGPFGRPYGIKGAGGALLGVVHVLIQSMYSFDGVELGIMVGREVKNSTKNIPRAVRHAWLRITALYLSAVLAAGLIDGAPWIIVFATARTSPVPKYILTVLFALSTLGTASTNIFVSSRFLFFLARRGHAPSVVGSLYKSKTSQPVLPTDGWQQQQQHETSKSLLSLNEKSSPAQSEVVVPWVAVLCGGTLALLMFMTPLTATDEQMNTAFLFFIHMTQCASLGGRIAAQITYLRFYYGTEHARRQDPGFQQRHQQSLYANRAWGQPWLAIYGLTWCIVILLFQGWSVFTTPGFMRIAQLHNEPPITSNPEIGGFATAFTLAYTPIGLFLMLYFGYKLVYQTSVVAIEDMRFARGHVPQTVEPAPTTLWEKTRALIL